MKDKMHNQNYEIIYFMCYIGMLFLAWTLYTFFVSPNLNMQHSPLYSYDVFKLLIWVLPIFAYLKYEKVNVLTYLKLKGQTNNAIKWTILVSLIFIVYQLLGRLAISQEIRFNLFFGLDKWIKVVLLAGFTEELLFRGFLLQKIAKYIHFEFANIITAIFFLLIHIPGLFVTHQFPTGIVLKISLFSFLFIFSIIEGYILKKSGSLWACIVIHSINNFMDCSLGG
jgi:membrane protease YdiL (CAAX protease family)